MFLPSKLSLNPATGGASLSRRGVRNPSEIFRTVLADAGGEVLVLSKKAGHFKHRGIRGDERAAALTHFLRKHLPDSLGVAKGEIIDYRDKRTGQLDVIVYDRQKAAPISAQDENLLLPCESLYAVFEVKTMITQDGLNKSFNAAQIVKSLEPFKHTFTAPRTDGLPSSLHEHRCYYVIFGYKSNLSSTNWLAKEFDRVRTAAAESQSARMLWTACSCSIVE